jgi:hypothetical protein
MLFDCSKRRPKKRNNCFGPNIFLKRFFGFADYRTYAGEPLQQNAVQAAVDNKSLLSIFPTGTKK